MKLRKFKIHKLQDIVELDKLTYLYAVEKAEAMLHKHFALKYKQGITEYCKLHGDGNDRYKRIVTGNNIPIVYRYAETKFMNKSVAWDRLYREVQNDVNLRNRMKTILEACTVTQQKETINID